MAYVHAEGQRFTFRDGDGAVHAQVLDGLVEVWNDDDRSAVVVMTPLEANHMGAWLAALSFRPRWIGPGAEPG